MKFRMNDGTGAWMAPVEARSHGGKGFGVALRGAQSEMKTTRPARSDRGTRDKKSRVSNPNQECEAFKDVAYSKILKVNPDQVRPSVMIQQKFGLTNFKIAKAYGGRLRNKAKNRGARPLCTKRSIHLVLWSSKAKGEKSFTRKVNRILLEKTLGQTAKRFGVRIYRIGNSGNHIHLIVKLTNRFLYSGFIRALTGTLALKMKIKWDFRPFTRIIEWGKDFKRACDYVYLNELEGAGLVEYSKTRLRGVSLYPWKDSA